MKRPKFNVDGLSIAGGSSKSDITKLLKYNLGAYGGLATFSRIRTGVTKAVFPEELIVSKHKILDPQDKSVLFWNKLLVISCILSMSVDPLFFYLPLFKKNEMCIHLHKRLAYSTTTLRTIIDVFYCIRMFLQFRTAYIAPSSRVFGRGELVIDPAQIARRYLSRYFVVDLISVLPLPQIVIWRFLGKKGGDVLATKQALLHIVMFQYIFRAWRFVPLTSELKKTVGVFADSAWAGAAFYLLLFVLASHIVGALWYLLAVDRKDTCWEYACMGTKKCKIKYLYCGHAKTKAYKAWRNISRKVLNSHCSVDDEDAKFDYGIYLRALSSGIVESDRFLTKYFFCLWFGLQNLSTLGQGLETSTFHEEVIFSIFVAIFGLILFALLIGNMQTYLQSITIRLEEMRIKRRDSEQWMHHRLLPPELRERVRRYDQYKWLETRGVDEESLVQSLPKDLRRDIKRHLCLNLVKKVPLFANMDDQLLDAICERLKPSLYTEGTFVVREMDPVNEMLFIIRGRLESTTTDGGRTGFFNRGILKESDFCGEELLTWALDPKAGSNLPPSTRTVQALSEVEAFALIADEMKFITSQFRRLHTRQVQHTFRFYSQQWRTWAAIFIQAAWRRFSKRKIMELRLSEAAEDYEEEEESDMDDDDDDDEYEAEESDALMGGPASSFGATMYASRFATNALRGVHRLRSTRGPRGLMNLSKPPEPDFGSGD